MNNTEAELESFRQKWREEVSAKAKGKSGESSASASRSNAQASSSKPHASKSNAPEVHGQGHGRHRSIEEIDEVEPHVYQDLGDKQHGRRLDETSIPSASASSSKEPRSALEHYEKAVEKETQGSLGDSLNLYRKAFKLDSNVHQTYKNKHFPPSFFQAAKAKAQDTNPSNASATVPNTAHHSLQGTSSTIQSLLEEFSSLSIQGEPPPTEFSPPPPCPIASIPEEILTEVLIHLAVSDVASFARVAQVCKRLAYLVATEEQVWKRVSLGSEYGFAAMHYDFTCQIDGKPLGDDDEGGYILGTWDDENDSTAGDDDDTTPPDQATLTSLLVPSIYPTFRSLFRQRPRIRFNGCYISTVNYTRPGASSPTSISWNSPIHIVTYYRYLRFMRDGSCISLLTTSEPPDVVPFLHMEHVHKNHGNLPSAPMKDALLGRWRLSGPAVPALMTAATNADTPDVSPAQQHEKEGTVFIETEGVAPKYMNRMILSLASAGKGARNNKLNWQGYWSYNRLTDDWGEYGLKNDRDKAFYWSRVRSYGMGYEEGATTFKPEKGSLAAGDARR